MEQYTLFGKLKLDTSEAVSALNGVTSTANSALSNVGSSLSSLGSSMTSTGTKLSLAVTAPLVALGKQVVTTNMDFESAMAQVSAVSGATGEDLEKLTAKAREMGEKTKFSATESAQAFLYMSMAGWKTEDMLSGIEGMMNLAAASGEDLATTSDIVTDALTAFGLTAADSAHFGDVLAAASSNANTNVSMMGETFKYVAPIAGAMGFSAEDTAEAIGLMANAGIKSSQAGTSLRKIMTALTGDITISGKAIGDVTISTKNADGSMRSLDEIMTDMRSTFSKLSESEKAQNAETIAGKTAMSGLLAIMNAGESDVNKLSDAINNCDGASESMAETMNNTLSGQIKILLSELQELALQFGEILVPVLRDFVDILKDVVHGFQGMSEGQREMILKAVALAAALGPILVILGNICSGVGNLISLISKVGPIISGLGSGFSTVFAGIGDVISGAIMAVSNFVSMWQNGWDIIKTILEALGIALAAIGAVLLGAPAAVAAVVAAIVFAISQLAIVIHDNWDAIKAWTKDLFESIGNWFKEAGENVANFFKNIGEWAKEAFESVGEFFSNAVKKISDGFHNVVSSVTDMGSKVKAQFDKLGDNLHNASENIKSKLSTAWSSMKDNAVDTFKTMRENVASTMAGFKDQWVGEFVQAKDNIISTFVNMKSNVINEAKHLASSCNEAFSNIAEKAVSGFNKIKEDGMSALMSLKDNAFNAFKEVGEFISSKFQAIADGIGGIFKGVDEEVHKIIDKVMSFFDFDWKLPDIKLPHFSVGWKTDGWMAEAAQFLGLKGIPDINVEWYKDGGIMTQPTPFGYNAATGSVMAGGEAGPEAILPIDNLREYIRDEIDSSAMLGTMRDMLSIMQRYLPQQAQSLNNLNFKVNDREFARLVKAVD